MRKAENHFIIDITGPLKIKKKKKKTFWLVVFQSLDGIFIFLFFIYLFFLSCLMAYGILVRQPGIEPGPSAVRAWIPNHLTSGEFPRWNFKILYFTISDCFICHSHLSVWDTGRVTRHFDWPEALSLSQRPQRFSKQIMARTNDAVAIPCQNWTMVTRAGEWGQNEGQDPRWRTQLRQALALPWQSTGEQVLSSLWPSSSAPQHARRRAFQCSALLIPVNERKPPEFLFVKQPSIIVGTGEIKKCLYPLQKQIKISPWSK